MSGTSCDGVDAALIEVRGRGLDMNVRFIEMCSTPYPDRLRHELLDIMAPAKTRTEQLAALNVAIGQAFAHSARELMAKCKLRPEDLAAIGSHGQTVCHMPAGTDGAAGATLQLGEPAVIAAETGVTVVADFRPADIAVGGLGAPLVPWTDYVLFRSESVSRCIQNIGGIANVTHLPAGVSPDRVIAFDTGPGCMVIDEMIRRASEGKRQFDHLGQFASRGTPDVEGVDQMMQLPYFLKRPPKTAGREEFGRGFAAAMLKFVSRRELDKYEKIATATLLTARSIGHAYRNYLDPAQQPQEVILCGGGARNQTLVQMIARELPQTRVSTVEDFGIPLQAKESVSFAMLAAACLDGIPANLPQVTGAKRPAILGKVVRV